MNLLHEADRPEEREDEREQTEHDRPEPLRAEAEELVGERRRRGGDDEELEDRPPDSLQDVDPGREQRAALTERRAHERHARDARVGADQSGGREHQVPDEAAEQDRDERVRERERRNEHRTGDDHEQRGAEVPP